MQAATPNSPDPAPGLDPGVASRLLADAYHHLVHTLCLALPLPPGEKPAPDDFARRNRAAVTRISALVPANPAEADIAAMFVAASEHWKNCFRLADLPETLPDLAAKCRAQANSMMRQAESALRLLLKLQEARAKREADSTTRDRAARTEHCALGFMVQALAALPAIAQLAPAVAKPPAPASPSKPAPREPAPAKAGDTGPKEMSPLEMREAMALAPDRIAAAERYAATYPERAAYIRRTGKMPPGDVRYFDPPEATLAIALIRGRTPVLAALDLIAAGTA